jgi:sporulation protein YlmC with PRC-barrel domain
MLKTLMFSTAICGLMMTGAMAQQSNMGGSNMSSASASPKFISSQSANQWVFSKFKGTDVLGPDNAKIGDVNDLLFEKDGKIQALIVGVGGLLGVGQKNVAIDMSAFQVVPASTGSSSTTSSMSSDNDPANVKLKVSWTKDQLKDAPDFQYYKSSASTSSSAKPSSTSGQRGGGMAPPAGGAAPAQRQ